MSEYRVNIGIFVGPLDLLLYLVRKEEVDIYDISITQITEEYLKYIEMMKNLDLEVAGDFLVMAAALMEIKSAMLLPKADIEEADEDGQEDDPRSELIRQLLEYKKFKDAANMLDEQAVMQSLRFSRPDVIMEKLEPEQEPEVEIEQISVWDLLSAFDTILKATGNYRDYSSISDDTPIDLYQIEILHRLQSEGPMSFENVFKGRKNKLVLVGLFLGMLELMREKLIWAEQEDACGPIYIKAMTDEPAETAVKNAIFSDKPDEELVDLQQEERENEQESENRTPPIPIQEIKPNSDKPAKVDEVEKIDR